MAKSRTLFKLKYVCGHCQLHQPPFYISPLYNCATSINHSLILLQPTTTVYFIPIITMIRRVIATAPQASRALSASVRPAINSHARIAAPAPISARRCYHEKDKLHPFVFSMFYTPIYYSESYGSPSTPPLLEQSTNAQLTSNHS